jgi:hypothetical protein
MAIPDRPVAAAAIETEWGQAVHDYTFAPSGCSVHSSSGTSCGTTSTALQLDTVDDDPGGYLDAANDRIEVPTGGEGLYSVYVQGNSVNGSAGTGFQTRCQLVVNGSVVSTGIEDNNGATNVVVPISWVGDLAAGDLLTVTGQRKGAGTNPSVSVTHLVMYRVGSELGA